jgi:hypothetical protein
MNGPFRIYYECYEQAAHFLVPALLHVVPSANIELVRISKITKSSKSTVADTIVRSLLFKNPDSLFTVIHENKEFPLAWLEISTAVETEDHDLQRFDSIVSASLSKIPFIKVWARRKSPSDHGGKTAYDKTISIRVARQILKIPAFEIDWPTSLNELQAIRNPNFNACPPNINELASILKISIDGVYKFKDPCKIFLGNNIIDPWILNQTAISLMPIPPHTAKNSSRLYKNGSTWFLKFNRWGHAMDPERGLAWFYRYRLNNLLSGIIHDKSANTILVAISNFQKATGIQVGPYKSSGPHNIDNQIILSQLNSAGRTIVANCSSFTVCDSSGSALITFTWSVTLQHLINIELKKCANANITVLKKFTTTEEDDVTYAVSCDLYPINGFKIESVSYPGAQGDRALLDTTGGRSVKRTYIDVVASKKLETKTLLSLTESKGTSSPVVLKLDADKVLSWKHDPVKRNTLLATYGVNYPNTEILCSVAYPGLRAVTFPGMNSLDFVVAVDNNAWVMWTPASKTPNGFTTLKGVANVFPRWYY